MIDFKKIIILWLIMSVLLSTLLVWFAIWYDTNMPCDSFNNMSIGHIPVRCINYYLK